MKLWVDDMRDAPDDSWTVVRKVQPAIAFLRQFRPTTISLDHDIENRPDDETFKPIAYFIGEMYNNDVFWADDLEVRVHSDNPVGAKEIIQILEDYGILGVEWTPYTSQADFAKKFGL
jgi:hypothetical protein